MLQYCGSPEERGRHRAAGPDRTTRVSAMSDFDRNYAGAGYAGQGVSRADAAVIDQGLRAYMLQIYNYMVLGLAITGLAALGVYMLSVTGDAAQAAKVLRNGV